MPLEASVLETCVRLRAQGTEACHGFLIARTMQEIRDARLLTGHGTLYRALGRLEHAGFLASTWEDPYAAAEEGRPRRRLYRVTAAGEQALANALATPSGLATQLRRRRAAS